MLKKPKIAPHFLAQYIPDGELILVSEHESNVLRGEAFGVLLPLLNGKLTINQILERTEGSCSEAERIYCINQLERHGYLVEAESTKGLRAARKNARSTQLRLRNVEIYNHSSESSRLLNDLLKTEGVKIRDHHDSLRIVLVDDYLDSHLYRYNNDAISSGRAWMLAKPAGNVLWLGPIFIPGETACWRCLENKIRLNRIVLRFIQRHMKEKASLPVSRSPILSALAYSLLATEILHWVQGATYTLKGTIKTFDSLTNEFKKHIVTRRPQCQACGDVMDSEPQPVQFDECFDQIVSRDGGLRSRTAIDTFNALRPHISGICGITSGIHPITTLDESTHVYVAGPNLGATGNTLKVLIRNLQRRSAGKGVSDAQAKASALCEVIERYAAVFQGDEHYLTSSAEGLGSDAILPNDCMLFSERQYRQSAKAKQGSDASPTVPRKLRAGQNIWWSPVWSLTDAHKRYCPTAYLYFHSEALRDNTGIETCHSDSNGNAAGTNYAEAMLQGILELIERDAIAIWWYPRVMLPNTDLSSFKCEFINASRKYHSLIGRELWVLDATSDLGIPTFIGVSRKMTTPERIVMGFGAHVDARIAIQRAIAETNQMLAFAEARVKDEGPVTNHATAWLESATVERECYLRPHPSIVVKSDEYPDPPTSIRTALDQCLTAVQKAGLEAYYIDLSRRDIDLKVVKVLCPGLRHFWPRLAPGRLYDIPVKLGRVTNTYDEGHVNPIPLFL